MLEKSMPARQDRDDVRDHVSELQDQATKITGDIVRIEARMNEFHAFHANVPRDLAVHDVRLDNLERRSEKTWQIWMAVFIAVLSLLANIFLYFIPRH